MRKINFYCMINQSKFKVNRMIQNLYQNKAESCFPLFVKYKQKHRAFKEFNDYLDLMVLDCSSYIQLLSLVINPQEITCASDTTACVMNFEQFEQILNTSDDVLMKSIWVYKTFFFSWYIRFAWEALIAGI